MIARLARGSHWRWRRGERGLFGLFFLLTIRRLPLRVLLVAILRGERFNL